MRTRISWMVLTWGVELRFASILETVVGNGSSCTQLHSCCLLFFVEFYQLWRIFIIGLATCITTHVQGRWNTNQVCTLFSPLGITPGVWNSSFLFHYKYLSISMYDNWKVHKKQPYASCLNPQTLVSVCNRSNQRMEDKLWHSPYNKFSLIEFTLLWLVSANLCELFPYKKMQQKSPFPYEWAIP